MSIREFDSNVKKRIKRYRKFYKEIRQGGYDPSEPKIGHITLSMVSIEYTNGESQYLGDPIRIYDLEIEAILMKFQPNFFRDIYDFDTNNNIVIRMATLLSIYLMKSAIYLSEELNINLDSVIEEFVPKSYRESVKKRILERAKGANSLYLKYFIEETKFDFQDLQKAKDIYTLLFNINICHDISSEKEYQRIDEYLNLRHTLIHKEKGMVRDVDLNNTLILNMIRDYTVFCHNLYRKIDIKPHELVFNKRTGKWEKM